MKSILKYTTSFIMILTLLVSTLQFSVYKMECLMSGNIKISLSDFEDCNNSNKDGCSITERCCSFHEFNLDFDFETYNTDNQNTVILRSFLVREVPRILSQPILSKIDFFSFTSLPPPGGFELLKVVQVFRL